MVAAVIDTGIDAGHRDLDEGKVLTFKDFVNGRTDPYDDEGHGRHVAATIAGDGDGRADGAYAGVAPGAGLVGVKVLDANGGARRLRQRDLGRRDVAVRIGPRSDSTSFYASGDLMKVVYEK